MKKKYIIIANESVNPSVADSITDYLIKEQKMEVWHWIANAWLAVTDSPGISKEELQKDLILIASRAAPWLIVEASGTKDIVGYGNPQQAEWINKHWRTD